MSRTPFAGWEVTTKAIYRMRSSVRVGLVLVSIAAINAATFAGPELDFRAAEAAVPISGEPQPIALIDVDQMLATPGIPEASRASSDQDLDSREHPMIPLPSSFWMGMILLAGVATYAARQQRSTRHA